MAASRLFANRSKWRVTDKAGLVQSATYDGTCVQRGLRRGLWSRRTAIGAIALLGAAPTQALAHAPGSPVQRGATAAQGEDQPLGCTNGERRRALAADQRLVLDRVGDLRTLDDPTDLTALAGLGWNVLPHGNNSFRGMGVAVLRGEELANPEPLSGRPALLLYRPDPGASDVTDPFGADFPYRLAGWGYLGSYDYARHPTGAGPCFRRSDWFAHERGVHDFESLGFVPVPPREDFHGQDAGDEPFIPFPLGFPHPRFWDMHLWLGVEGVPTVSMLNPGMSIPGIDPRVGVSFFYPLAIARPDQASPRRLSRIRLSVRPRRTRVARRATRFHFTAVVAGRPRTPVGRALIRFAGRKERTNGRGSATIRVRFRSEGRHEARAIKRGMRGGTAWVRVLRSRRS